MDLFSKPEIEIFCSQIKRVRPLLPHPIAELDLMAVGWARLPSSVLGAYNHIRRRITLNIDYRRTPEFLTSTLAHELHHQWQHESMGWRYWLAANWLTRGWMLERTAREVENECDRLLGLEGLRDGDSK
jgi:hypothetical protein